MINASIRLKGVEEGLEQTARYVDICGCSKGWLAIFDCRSTVQWDDKIYMKKETVDGKTITTVGL
jgi:Holliday junction resolvase